MRLSIQEKIQDPAIAAVRRPGSGPGRRDGRGPRAQSPANPISLHAPSQGQAKGGKGRPARPAGTPDKHRREMCACGRRGSRGPAPILAAAPAVRPLSNGCGGIRSQGRAPAFELVKKSDLSGVSLPLRQETAPVCSKSSLRTRSIQIGSCSSRRVTAAALPAQRGAGTNSGRGVPRRRRGCDSVQVPGQALYGFGDQRIGAGLVQMALDQGPGRRGR